MREFEVRQSRRAANNELNNIRSKSVMTFAKATDADIIDAIRKYDDVDGEEALRLYQRSRHTMN